MRTQTQRRRFLFKLLLVSILVLSFDNVSSQQNILNEENVNNYEQKVLSKNARQNLITALYSPNDGLRISAVYFIGKYKFTEFEKEVIELMEKETDTNNKKLLAVCLFQMGTNCCIANLEKIAKSSSEEDKEFYLELISKYQRDETEKYIFVSNVLYNLNQERN